jgi:hypothetical protein
MVTLILRYGHDRIKQRTKIEYEASLVSGNGHMFLSRQEQHQMRQIETMWHEWAMEVLPLTAEVLRSILIVS